MKSTIIVANTTTLFLHSLEYKLNKVMPATSFSVLEMILLKSGPVNISDWQS